MTAPRPETEPFELAGGSGQTLRGESTGTGQEIFLCHGLSATRRYVVHGSLFLPRRGYRVTTWDARGHGESDPGPDGYGYERLTADLDAVVERAGSGRTAAGDGLVLGGHSMGCHTVVSWALGNPDRVAALILIGPVYTGQEEDPEMARWDARADALESEGPEAFAEAVVGDMPQGSGRDTVYRLARDRARLHRNPEAVAQALREVPRSRPFDQLGDLSRIDAPVLVVGSRDEIDPGHPLAAAESYAEEIPGSEFIVEDEGKPPLAWQGGMLSREIDGFLDRNGLGGR
ncbi:MAG: alpha/beta hydrolase [Actinomycetota bacterium]|nr:alpha/beta hydrolase [Actinomycetota bacterium]